MNTDAEPTQMKPVPFRTMSATEAELRRRVADLERQNAALLEVLQPLVDAIRVCSGKAWAGSEKTPKQWADSALEHAKTIKATASSPEPGDK